MKEYVPKQVRKKKITVNRGLYEPSSFEIRKYTENQTGTDKS
jgi:hypothetical protein